MRFRFNKDKSQPEKITKYSIRKFHFGAASVAVASLLFFGSGSVQAADNVVSPSTANPNTHQSEPTTSSGGNSSGDSGSAGKPDAPATTAATQVAPTTTVTQPTIPAETEKTTEAPKVDAPSATTPTADAVLSTTSEISSNKENEAVSTNAQSVPAEANEVEKSQKEEKAEEADKKADVTALQKALTELEEKLSKLKEESKKDSYQTLVTETKKVVENHEVTKETADKQLDLVKTAIKEVEEAIKKEAEQAKEESTTPKKRGKKTADTPAPAEEPKALPTYKNGTDNYALAEEMRKIVKYLKDNGADDAKVAAIKANYDKLNEKLGLTDENAVLSEADFATATANLKAARDTIEAFLDSKSSVPGTERSVGDGARRRERAAGQDRDGSNDYKNSLEYYFEDGKKGVSPYDRYTYVFYTSRQSGVAWDGVRKPVEEGRDFIYADVTPTNNGFKWDIYINRARHDLSDTVGWFTLPKGTNVVGNSVTISWSNSEGNRAISPNDGRIETALSQAGLRMVTKGTTKESGIDKRNAGYAKNWNSNDIKALATTGGVSGNNPYRFDLLNNDRDGRTLQDAKINAIYNNNGDLYYFQQGADRTTYHLSFETTGITKKRDLIYAAGMKGERVDETSQPPVRVRFIANQWSAKTALEKTDADEYSPTITYPAYIVKQGEYKNQKYGFVSNWDRHPERTDKILNYGDQSYTKSDFDANNYYHFEARNGKSSETILGEANARGFNKNFRMYKPDGTEISKHDMGNSGADTPGDFEYTWKWHYNDGSKASEHVRFIVVPKEPRLTTDLTNAAGRKNVEIKAAGGTNGFKMELYHKVGGVLTKVSEAIAGANGEATFTLDNNNRPLVLEVGDYVVKTVADLNKDYRDYAGVTHKKEDGLKSGESNVQRATDGAPPVVRMVGSTDPLPDTRPADNAPAVYEVTQGQPFEPRLEAFDNLGVIKKFELDNFPAPLRRPFRESNGYSERESYEPRFNGNIPANTEPGVYTRTIKVSDGVTGDKTYYFKYKVLPTAPTITTEAKYNGTLVSTDRSISGTGVAGATITVTLQDGTTGTTTVNNQGKWTYNLKANEKLTQNTKQDASIKANSAITIKQTKNGAESAASTVNVQLAKVISIDTPVQAGREITVKAAHDTGRFYVQVYNNKNDRQAAYEYGVKQENGRWVLETGSDKSDLIVANGDNVSEKKFTLRIKDANKKTNFPFKITANSVVKVRSHHVNNQNNPANPANDSDGGWIIANTATNTNPTITVKAPNTHNYTADGSLTMAGLKNLVTVADAEDDADKTVGNRVGDNFNLTIKKGNQVVNLANNEYLKKGDYTLTYTTTDAAGATVTKEHTITVNYTAVAKPTINLIKGETLTEAEKRSLLQLQDGTSKIDVPSDARVEVALDTSSESNGKTASATVVFADNTRTAPININYKVYKNFETVTKVYDFAGVGRNDSPSSYYLNPGGLPDGMSWVFKKGNGTVGTADNNKLKESLNADGVGSTTYNFGAKYPRGRFTDNPSEAEKLSYTPTFTHEVFDVEANNDSTTQKNRVEVNNGEKLSAAQAASAVVKTSNSPALPAGTTYEWVKSATDGTVLTDAEKNVTEFGEITRYVKVTLPKVSETGPNANQVQPYKIIPVTLKVNEKVKPTVQMDGRRLTTNAEDNKFVIFRGATFNPTFTVNDNSGTTTYLKASGLPSGREIVKNTAMNNGTTVQISGDDAKTENKALGTYEGSINVRDARGNNETYKFKYALVDVEVKNTPETVDKGTKLFVPGKAGESKDSHNYVKAVVSPNTDGSDVYYPGGMNFKWSKNNAEITSETVFNTPGTITYNAVVKFPNAKSDKNNVDIDGDGRNENVTIYAPDKIERTVTFKVKPTAPTIAPQTNGDVTITPANETNVNTLNFTYIHPNGSTQNITATKTGNTWSLTNAPADGVTINENTGVVTIKDRAVKDNQMVTAKSVTADSAPADRVESDITNSTSPNGDTERPKFVFQPDTNSNTGEKVVEGGKQIVYVTPTESTDITIGNVTDNSGKLLEVRISDSNNRDFNLGLGSGVTNNEVIRANNTEHDAPRPVTITGTVSKLNGRTPWNNGDVLTRFVQAQDAATNGIDTQGNSNQVTFKILTQAEKYTPTVETQLLNKDVTANGAKVTADEFTAIKNAITFTAERGTLKISNAANNRTTGLDIAMKDEGTIKHDDAGYYVEATVSYPDGTSEVVRVNVDKSDKEAPKVKLHGVELKENSTENPKFIVFRGAKFDPTFEVTDNANPITSLSATGLPTGTFSKTGSIASGTRVQITENNIVPTGDTVALGEHEASVTIKDASNNEKTYNFKYIVADVEVKNTPETVALGTKLVDAANSGNGKDAHNYVKAVIESNTDGNDKYYAPTMSFKWSKDGAIVENTTTFDTPGIVKYKAVADFFNGGGTYTKTVEGVGNNIKIYAPNKIEREVTFKVQPTAPTVTPKDNGDVEVTNENQQNVNKITVTYTKQEGATPVEVTYTATKKTTGWELEAGAPLTIDSTTGTIKISDAEVKDKTSVKTKAITTDDVESTEVNGTAKGATPTAKETTVKHNAQPNAEDSIGNKDDLPAGTTYAWKPDATPNTSTPGTKPGKVIVTYPDTSTEEVDVVVKVRKVEVNGEPEVQPELPEFNGGVNGEPEVQPELSEYNDGVNGEPEVQLELPEFNGGVNGEPEVQPENPGYNGPIGTTGVDENGELIQPPVVDIPEFNGGVNGELPDPVQLPKVQLIITKWTDEQGNELKPADAKAPAVLGESNEAFEVGEIEGYVFVRTETKGDVVTHIFRKVTPTKPEGNGEQQGGNNKPQPTPEVPTDHTEHKPEVVTPDEQPAETENTTTKPKASQNILPNTGTARGIGIFSAAAASILAGLGLIIPVKKEDEEEEETQNN